MISGHAIRTAKIATIEAVEAQRLGHISAAQLANERGRLPATLGLA